MIEFKILGARYLVAGGADVVAELNDEMRFRKHVGPELAALRIIAGDSVFTAYNDEPNWQRAHELLMPAFTQTAMRRYHPVMVEVAGQLTGKWDQQAAAGQTVEVSAETTRMTLETIGRCAADYSFDAFGVHPSLHRAHGGRAAGR